MDKFKTLLKCAYCGSKGKMLSYQCKIQGIRLYKAVCSKDCDSRASTFAVKYRECAVEQWNAIFHNVNRLKK